MSLHKSPYTTLQTIQSPVTALLFQQSVCCCTEKPYVHIPSLLTVTQQNFTSKPELSNPGINVAPPASHPALCHLGKQRRHELFVLAVDLLLTQPWPPHLGGPNRRRTDDPRFPEPQPLGIECPHRQRRRWGWRGRGRRGWRWRRRRLRLGHHTWWEGRGRRGWGRGRGAWQSWSDGTRRQLWTGSSRRTESSRELVVVSVSECWWHGAKLAQAT